MSDHLGLFDRADDDTGNLDLDELRAALARSAALPPEPPGLDGLSAPIEAAGVSAPAVQVVRSGARGPVSPSRGEARARREALQRRRRRRRRHTLVATLVLVVLAAAIAVGVVVWRKNIAVVPNYSGDPGAQTVVRVQSGDSREDVAASLLAAGVVASTQSFLDETTNDGDVARLRPGYYRLATKLSARAAADALVDPADRVGQLRIVPGRRLIDITTTAGSGKPAATVEGYLSAITKAACVPLNGRQNCWSEADLAQLARTADPVALGVVDWAVARVRAAPDPDRRLEGMIVPGDYDVPPGSTPLEALRAVVGGSAANWNTSAVVSQAKAIGVTPYQAAIIASLVEREGVSSNMTKVARVIYNRIQVRMKLQLDSTVDYALNQSQLATTAADRENASPYNTYAHTGLPPTPITSPGAAALDATLDPAAGPWVFFVKTDKANNFCFSITFAEHQKCVELARKNGVFG